MGQAESTLVPDIGEEDLPVAQIISHSIPTEAEDISTSDSNSTSTAGSKKERPYSDSFPVPSSVKSSKRISPKLLQVPHFSKHPVCDYDIRKKLYDGTFSKVYKAVMKRNDRRRVAIKEMTLIGLKDRHKEAIQQEMNILSQLQHRNIVQLYAVYYLPHNEKVFLVTEYLRGGDLLSAMCQWSTYSERIVQTIIRQVAQALQYMHQRHIIHRDIKPLNLLLAHSDSPTSTSSSSSSSSPHSDAFISGLVVKIVDFGFAIVDDSVDSSSNLQRESFSSSASSLSTTTSSSFSDHASTGNCHSRLLICGTPGYIAPEVYVTRTYSTQVDVWSLGCVLYVLLSGILPFRTDKEGLRATKHGKFSFPYQRFKSISHQGMQLIERMLVVDPHDRLTIDEVLASPYLSDNCAAAGSDRGHQPAHVYSRDLSENLEIMRQSLTEKRGNNVFSQMWQGIKHWQECQELQRHMLEEEQDELLYAASCSDEGRLSSSSSTSGSSQFSSGQAIVLERLKLAMGSQNEGNSMDEDDAKDQEHEELERRKNTKRRHMSWSATATTTSTRTPIQTAASTSFSASLNPRLSGNVFPVPLRKEHSK